VLDKRQGFRPPRQNVLKEGGDLASFELSAWSRPPAVGRLRSGLVTEVNRKGAVVRLGTWSARLDGKSIEWTGRAAPSQVLKAGDVAPFLVLAIDEAKQELTVALDQEPLAEGALLAIDPATGEIKALVGGYDFNRSQFDRAIQARRQAGSAFKPFVYTAALDAGYTLADTVFDEPSVFIDPATGDEYQPNNYYRKYYGITTLREAMEESRNIVAVKLLNQVGFGRTIEIARRMGITSPLQPYPSMALGTMEVSLHDLTTAYSIFPNQGVRVEPHFIRYVADREGRIREEAKPKVIEVLRADVGYVMTYLLEGVTESGTGAAAALALNRAVAGKTGTTDDLADAWFVGFSPSLVAGVWVGFDEKRSLGEGETGARAALPIWIDFMKASHEGRPPEKFTRPANVQYVPIDRRTGLRATVESGCAHTFLEAFVAGSEPAEACSEARHFQIDLPYFLQRYPVTRALEIDIDPEAVVRIVNEGQGEVELDPDGRTLILKGEGAERRIALDLRRGERRDVLAGIEGGPAPPEPPPDEAAEPIHVGVDGRPATIIPIKYD
jgi:penicillin-binding protein 1A